MEENKTTPNFLNKFDYINCTNEQLKSSLNNALVCKLQAIEFYEKLIQLSPNNFEYNQILEIIEDEKSHLQQLKALDYLSNDQVEFEPITFRTYRDGLLKAYDNELALYSTFRNIYSLAKNKEIQDFLFNTVTDELMHANRFMFLYFRDNL